MTGGNDYGDGQNEQDEPTVLVKLGLECRVNTAANGQETRVENLTGTLKNNQDPTERSKWTSFVKKNNFITIESLMKYIQNQTEQFKGM